MKRHQLVPFALPLLLVSGASSLTGQDPADGFVVRYGADIAAPPTRVYEALVEDIGTWWDSEHTFSRNAANLSLDARPGGCLCEQLPGGGGVEHLRVVFVDPGRRLRLSGALGPLQGSALVGTLTWTLSETQGGTHLEMTYAVGGYMEGGLESIAPAVESVLTSQMRRLGRYVETGKPGGAPDGTPRGG